MPATLGIAARVRNGYIAGHLHMWWRGPGAARRCRICRGFEAWHVRAAVIAIPASARACPRFRRRQQRVRPRTASRVVLQESRRRASLTHWADDQALRIGLCRSPCRGRLGAPGEARGHTALVRGGSRRTLRGSALARCWRRANLRSPRRRHDPRALAGVGRGSVVHL
jgi:hypothetical protein